MDKKLGALTAAAAVAGAGAAVVLAKKGAGGQKAVEKLCGTAYSKELFVRMPARILDDLPPDFRKPPAREEAT